ncbi:hypothetical protein diail_8490 [Diaporthe ilicicola]|nr:hypothetical protein diail_8490 [Diaporthe ilicicola]
MSSRCGRTWTHSIPWGSCCETSTLKYFNYLNGKLIDFSRAWTMYHPSLHVIDPRLAGDQLIKTDVIDLENLTHAFWNQNYSSVPEGFNFPQGLIDCTGGNGGFLVNTIGGLDMGRTLNLLSWFVKNKK